LLGEGKVVPLLLLSFLSVTFCNRSICSSKTFNSRLWVCRSCPFFLDHGRGFQDNGLDAITVNMIFLKESRQVRLVIDQPIYEVQVASLIPCPISIQTIRPASHHPLPSHPLTKIRRLLHRWLVANREAPREFPYLIPIDCPPRQQAGFERQSADCGLLWTKSKIKQLSPTKVRQNRSRQLASTTNCLGHQIRPRGCIFHRFCSLTGHRAACSGSIATMVDFLCFVRLREPRTVGE
jgi:hypothetical protein